MTPGKRNDLNVRTSLIMLVLIPGLMENQSFLSSPDLNPDLDPEK